MTSSLRLGRLAGVEIGLHWSWALIFALIVWSLADGVFPETNPGLADGTYLAMAVVAVLLFYEHSLVRPGDLSRLDAAFFTMNGVISLLLFGFVLAGRLYVAWATVPPTVR